MSVSGYLEEKTKQNKTIVILNSGCMLESTMELFKKKKLFMFRPKF